MSSVPSARPDGRSALHNASGGLQHTLDASLAALEKYRRAALHVTLVCVVAAADRAVGDRLQIILELAGYIVERAEDVDYALACLKPSELLLALLTLRLPDPDGGAARHEVQLVFVLPVAPTVAAEQAVLAAGPDADRVLPSELAALSGPRPSLLRPRRNAQHASARTKR